VHSLLGCELHSVHPIPEPGGKGHVHVCRFSACMQSVRVLNCGWLLSQVKEFQDFRRSLPQESQVIVCKNSLMKKATERVERFLPLDTALAVRGRCLGAACAPAAAACSCDCIIELSALPVSFMEQRAVECSGAS
jgi:Ribosomal protein L10